MIHKPTGLNLLDPSASLNTVSHSVKRKWIPIYRARQSFSQSFKQVLSELLLSTKSRRELCDTSLPSPPFLFIAAIKGKIETLAIQEALKQHEMETRTLFADIFAPVPHVDNLPLTDTVARIPLSQNNLPHGPCRNYTIPKHWEKAMDNIINLRLSQGFIRPSTSTFASPSFLVPKSDPKAQPRWVCDYRRLNNIAIPNHYPMPKISEILSDCAKGKFFCKIDLKDSYFQTRMPPTTSIKLPF